MIVFQPLSESHNTSGFACGTKPFDDYIQQQAIYEQSRGITRTFVAIEDTSDSPVALGYFTLKATDKTFTPEPGGLRELLHPVELVYLARDLTWRKTGMGAGLLIEALRLSVEASERIGLPGIYLRSTSQGARLYESFGFTRVDGGSFYMPMHRAKGLIEKGDSQ